MNDEIKEKILNFLKDKNNATTSEIASILNRNYYDASQFLEDLEKENIVEKIQMNKFTFWKIKNA